MKKSLKGQIPRNNFFKIPLFRPIRLRRHGLAVVAVLPQGSRISTISFILCGVPQGSALGPTLFVLNTTNQTPQTEQQGLRQHLYDDDTWVYGRSSPSSISDDAMRVAACIDDIMSWMKSNRLQLNTNKSDFMWRATNRRLHQLSATSIGTGTAFIWPSSSVRNRRRPADADSRSANGGWLFSRVTSVA